MEKIVVISRGSDQDRKLIKCLRALFPECEIDIQQRIPGNYDTYSLEPDDEDTKLSENIEKYLSFL